MDMKRAVLLIGMGVWCGLSVEVGSARAAGRISVAELRCEYDVNPLGIDARQPRMSWQVQSSGRNQVQTAYQVLVARSPKALSDGDLVWDSGKVTSSQTVSIPYEGNPLRSGTRYYWKVRVWDGTDAASQYESCEYRYPGDYLSVGAYQNEGLPCL